MPVVKYETFGPVSPVIRFRDIDEAIRIANGTDYGLSSSVCTNRLDYITRFVSELNVGSVNIREVPGYRLELTPFGGVKDSGLGYKERGTGSDEGLHQREDLVPPPMVRQQIDAKLLRGPIALSCSLGARRTSGYGLAPRCAPPRIQPCSLRFSSDCPAAHERPYAADRRSRRRGRRQPLASPPRVRDGARPCRDACAARRGR